MQLPVAVAGSSSLIGRRQRKRLCGLLAGLLVLALLVVASMVFGSRWIAPAEVLDALLAFDVHNDRHLVIRELRVPRTLVALLAGMALGLSGSIMQAVTRNPLAEPGLLGINAGAALAVMIGVATLQLSSLASYVWLGFLGAGLAGCAVFILGQAHETGTNPVRLVLAGAGLSVMLASITGIILLNAPPEVLDRFRLWAAGSLERSGLEAVAILAVAVLFGAALTQGLASNLNVMALGAELGQALGVNLRLTWLLACSAVMLLAGAATASAGPIAFVGLVAPHLARLSVGPDYRWILPYSALYAAVLLLSADVLGRLLAGPSEIAAGIVACLIGGPFFIAVVRRLRMSKL